MSRSLLGLLAFGFVIGLFGVVEDAEARCPYTRKVLCGKGYRLVSESYRIYSRKFHRDITCYRWICKRIRRRSRCPRRIVYKRCRGGVAPYKSYYVYKSKRCYYWKCPAYKRRNYGKVFRRGDTVMVKSKRKWYRSEILARSGYKYKIHYVGYSKRYDEWVGLNRIRPIAAGFRVGKTVEVRWKGKWYRSRILAGSGRKYKIKYYGYPRSKPSWVSSSRIRRAGGLRAGLVMKIYEKKKWYKVYILRIRDRDVQIRYIGYSRRYDSWVRRGRLSYLY